MSTFARNIRRSFIVSEVGKQSERAIQEAIVSLMASQVHVTGPRRHPKAELARL